jgi:hypothetical protein
VPDPVDAFLAGNPELVRCHNFGPVAPGGSGTYTIDSKFAVGSNIKVLMFSTPVKVFEGAVPSDYKVVLQIPGDAVAGVHKFIQYGVDTAGNSRVGGCVADAVPTTGSTTTSPSVTVANAEQRPSTSGQAGQSNLARTGREASSILVPALVLTALGFAFVRLARRRRAEGR